MKVKVKRVLVVVFGATTGVTLHEFVIGKGFRQIWKRDIPWIRDRTLYLWPMDWLKRLLAEVHAMATPGTIISSAMWGADTVHMAGQQVAGEVLHYRSVPEKFAEKIIQTSGIPAYEWSRLMGHVHPAFYQMVFSTLFMREVRNPGLFRLNGLPVIPLSDWITWQLSGQKGHDKVMLHNQGAGVPTSKLVNTYLGGAIGCKFAPVWPLYDSGQLLGIGKGAYVVPCTHDSPMARAVLASTSLPWGLWTGSWYGVFRKVTAEDKIEPSEKTFNADLVFEAMPDNGLSAISNIGMHGPLYKALKNLRSGLSYEQVAEIALAGLDQPEVSSRPYDSRILKKEGEDFARLALKEAGGYLDIALARMVNTISAGCESGLQKASLALGVPMPNKVAIVGGFAENSAIKKALKTRGIDTVVPPFAELATQAGAAAEALRRAGLARNISEALAMFPNKELS
jgi:hypothetical protein